MHNTDTLIFKLLNILFVIFSLFFLHTCFSLDADISALNLDGFIGILTTYKITTALALFLIFKILYLGELSIVVMAVFVLNIFYKVFSLFLVEYDKIILLFSVVFLLVSYNMILLLKEELAQAIFKPNFNKENFNFENFCILEGSIFLSSGSKIPVKVSNCDDKGIVIYTEEKISKGEKIDFEIEYEKALFTDTFNVELVYNNGYGLKLISNNNENKYSWNTLFNILKRRGIVSY